MTDIDRLHKVVSMDNPGRGAGRTFAVCHTVAGVLETTEEAGVICLVPKYDRINNIIKQMVHDVFPDHDIDFYRKCCQTRFAFFLPGKIKKYIQFAVPDDDTIGSLSLMGNAWPVVEFTECK